jgi:hypothetical protein
MGKGYLCKATPQKSPNHHAIFITLSHGSADVFPMAKIPRKKNIISP